MSLLMQVLNSIVTFSLVTLAACAAAFANEELPTVPVDGVSVLRLPDPAAKPNWADDVIARMRLSPDLAVEGRSTTIEISGDQILSRFPGALLNRRQFLQLWNGQNNGNTDYVSTFMDKRGESLNLNASIIATKMILDRLAAKKLPALSEKRVDYAVRSILLQAALTMKVIEKLTPNVAVAMTNEELYAHFLRGFGEEKGISLTFDWTGNSDRLSQLKREAIMEEKPLQWPVVELSLPPLPPTLDEFRTQMKAALQKRHAGLQASLKEPLLQKMYGEKYRVPLARAASSSSLRQQTFDTVKNRFWDAKVSAYLIFSKPKMGIVGESDQSAQVNDLIQEINQEIGAHPDLSAKQSRNSSFAKRYIDLVEAKVTASNVSRVSVRLDQRSFASYGALPPSKTPLERFALQTILREMQAEVPQGGVAGRYVRGPSGSGYLWLVVEKLTPATLKNPEVGKAVQQAVSYNVNALWTRLSLVEALRANPIEVVTRTSSEWAWPDLAISPEKVAALLLPAIFRPGKANAEELTAIQSGAQEISVQDLGRIWSFSRELFEPTLAPL